MRPGEWTRAALNIVRDKVHRSVLSQTPATGGPGYADRLANQAARNPSKVGMRRVLGRLIAA